MPTPVHRGYIPGQGRDPGTAWHGDSEIMPTEIAPERDF